MAPTDTPMETTDTATEDTSTAAATTDIPLTTEDTPAAEAPKTTAEAPIATTDAPTATADAPITSADAPTIALGDSFDLPHRDVDNAPEVIEVSIDLPIDRPTTYTVLPEGSKRRKPLLVSTSGYSYVKQRRPPPNPKASTPKKTKAAAKSAKPRKAKTPKKKPTAKKAPPFPHQPPTPQRVKHDPQGQPQLQNAHYRDNTARISAGLGVPDSSGWWREPEYPEEITKQRLLSNLGLQSKSACIQSSFHTQGSPLLFKATEVLSGEPMKKRKRQDPHLLIQRQQRKMKLLERELRKLNKRKRRLKPIVEMAIVSRMRRESETRLRENVVLSEESQETRALLQKEWSRDRQDLHIRETIAIRAFMASQQMALDELRKESEELYQQAIQIDQSLIPYTFKGPVNTPPIEGFDSPDGAYIDTTRTFD